MEGKNLNEIGLTKGLKIIHINTRSVFNKLDELKCTLHNFDIIVFTETWLNSSIDDTLLRWDNFELIRLDRENWSNKKRGGVCIYIRSSIDFEIVQQFSDSLGNDIEFIFVKIKPYMQKTINLIGIYRPPDGKYKDFIQHITRILNQIDRSRHETILLGDFNIDFNNKKLIASIKLDHLESKYALKQVIKGNTRVTNMTNTCIDLLFTDMKNIIDSGIVDYDISDHLPIYLVKKKIRNKIDKKVIIGRSYLYYEKEVFCRIFDTLDWEVFHSNTDPAVLWDCFCTNIVKVLDIICPIKPLMVVDNKPEWLTNELLTRMRQRDKAFKKARRTLLQADWDLARHLRNILCMDIKTAKTNVIKGKLERYGNNPKQFWQEINKLLPHSQNSTMKSLVDESTNISFEGMDLNNHINDYFSNIGLQLANDCTPSVNGNVDHGDDREVTNFNRRPFTVDEVLKVCNEIDVSKSASILNVKTMVLKHAFVDNINKVTKIFNCSLSHSLFPKAWKISTIVPLPKVPHPKIASELRPVALTPLPGKLMEKLICNRFQCWIAENNILSDVQHGFRKKKSTISAIAALLDRLYKNINKDLNSYVIYLDLKKAFDTICHVKLVTKLQRLGLDELTLKWFESYLTGRSQCVKLNSMISDILPVAYGVPQGSILGPILFSIYINDISNIVNCGIVLYADDTVIFHSDKDILRNNLKLISDWCNDNLLTINVKKSHWMKIKVCGKGNDGGNHGDEVFMVNKSRLTEVNVYKYLGVHIDPNLNFQPHHKKNGLSSAAKTFSVQKNKKFYK